MADRKVTRAEKARAVAAKTFIGAKYYATNWGIWILIGVVIVLLFSWILQKGRLAGDEGSNCTTMDKLYKQFPPISTIDTSESGFNYGLRDYYIKTAYNCCSAGQYKNDFVDICALKDCIRAGARCLDFAVYSVDNKPVIAVSSMEDYSTKESYNSVPFVLAMETIANNAFSSGATTCAGDPLIIHLRIMSKNTKIYTEMTKDIYNSLQPYILGKEYSYQNHNKNLGATNLNKLKGKVIIMVDKSNPLFVETPLNEYVNIASGSPYLWIKKYHDVKYTHNMDELIEQNKQYMTICLPDITTDTKNPSIGICESMGVQMTGMSFQNFDSNMEAASLFFNKEGRAFALKPEHLRYVEETVPAASKQKAALSFGPRTFNVPGGKTYDG